MLITYTIILLTGMSVGLISTIFGLGGGIIMVPLLSLILPFSHLEAIATSLMTIVFVAGFNTWNYSNKNVIVWKIVPWIAVTSSFFAFLSARVSTTLPDRILVIIFILFLLYIAIRTFFIRMEGKEPIDISHPRLLPLGIGSISGLISGVTGVGGGGITTPMMLVTGLARNIQAAPTSNAIMIFTAAFATLSFAFSNVNLHQPFTLGYIHLDTAFLLFLGSAAISRFGVSLNYRISLFWRKTVLGILLLLLCFRLILMIVIS